MAEEERKYSRWTITQETLRLEMLHAAPHDCLNTPTNFDCFDLVQFEKDTDFAVLPKLFGKWEYKDVKSSEIALELYLSVKAVKHQIYYPYSAGKYQKKRFQKV